MTPAAHPQGAARSEGGSLGMPIAGAACAAMVAACVAMLPARGLNLWALWQVENAERWEAWLRGGGGDGLHAAMLAEPVLMPFPGAWIAVTSGGETLTQGARFAAALFSGLLAWGVFSWGRRAGGAAGGFAALVALLLCPRFLAAATVPSPTIFAVATCVVAGYAQLRAQRASMWTGPAILAWVAALLTSTVAWWMIVPAIWLTVTEGGVAHGGLVRLRPLRAGVALPIPMGVGLSLVLLGALGLDGETVLAVLRYWLERPAEPFLFAGELRGPERIPIWGGPALWLFSVPVGIAFSSVLGGFAGGLAGRRLAASLSGGEPGSPESEEGEARRAVLIYGGCASLLPFALRTPFHGGIDLLAFSLLPVAVWSGLAVSLAAGAAASRLPSGGRGVRSVHLAAAGVAFGAAVAGSGVAEVAPYVRAPEAYWSALLGGGPGGVRAGFSRWAHGPLPPEIATGLVSEGATARVHVSANAWEFQPLIARYIREGLIRGQVEMVDVGAAEVVLTCHDDALPEYWRVVRDVVSAEQGAPERVIRFEAGGNVLVSAVRIR